jgi:hypothetical protein
MLFKVLDIFFTGFGDFPLTPLYFGFNSAEQDFWFLPNFEFEEPFEGQKNPIFFEDFF